MVLVHKVVYTDGAKHVAETAGAYWLLDEIALAQSFEAAVAKEEFQLWRLAVQEDASALLSCEDGDGREVYQKVIPFIDFPSPGIEFFCRSNTIHLPSDIDRQAGRRRAARLFTVLRIGTRQTLSVENVES